MGLTFRLGQLPTSLFTDASNNVGIGAAPSGSYKLEVTGTAKVSSTLLVSGASTLTGAVGVGIAAPSSGLEVYQSAGGATLRVTNSGTGTGSGNGFHIGTDGSSPYNVSFVQNENAAQVFYTNNGTSTDERMRILASGGVMIPSDVSGTSGYRINYTSADAGSRSWKIANDNAAYGDFFIAQSTTQSGSTYAAKFTINPSGNVGIGTTSPTAAAGLAFVLYSGASQGRICVKTSSTGDASGDGLQIGMSGTSAFIEQRENDDLTLATNASERMRILSGGCVGINTSSSSVRLYVKSTDATSSSYAFGCENGSVNLFLVQGDGRLFTGTAAQSPYNRTTGSVGNLFVDYDGSLYRGTASSQRFKENIIDWSENGLNTILALKPKTFTYKESYYSQPDRQFLGLIAEDVAEVSSYLVDFKNEDGTGDIENVRYANIVVPLIKAIQEQQAIITSLQDRLSKGGL